MKILKIFLNRIFIFGLLIFLQMIWMIFVGRELWIQYRWIYPLMYIISFLVVLGLVSKDENPSYKTVWIIVILLFPMFGGLLYLCIGNKKPSRKIRKMLEPVMDEMRPYMI